MTKAGLIAAVQREGPMSPTQAKAFVDLFFSLLHEGLATDGEVALHRFGTFELCDRPPKPVRDVAAGTAMLLPARKAVRFRAAKALRRQCAKGDAGEARGATRGPQLELRF